VRYYKNVTMDSYMVYEEEHIGVISDKRLLEVDNALLLPSHVRMRFVFTGADVIHS